MITKSNLMRALEPFDDGIEIQFIDRTGYLYSPNVYYTLSKDGYGTIVIGLKKPDDAKWVELRVE